MFRYIFTISFLSSISFILYQRIYINNLKNQIYSCSHRSKRSISMDIHTKMENEEKDKSRSISFPLYAQISEKEMAKLCSDHRRERKKKENMKKSKRMKEKSIREESYEEKNIERKKCSQHVSYSSPRLISRRSHWNGCALRDGNTWYVCEFHMGYTILEYADTSSLSASLPRALRTLPFPYIGTDSASINGSIAYSYDDQLVFYNIATSQTNRLPFNIHQDPLYNGSFSRMDIQSDEHGLWILYREKKKDTLTVSRVSIPSLKYLSLYIFCKYFLIRLLHTWNLPFQPSQYCNSFIRCGILHSITCSSQSSSIKPIYDFYSALPIIGKSTTLSGIREDVNSAQYDPISHSLSIFSRGLIYSISIEQSSQSSS
ncbi:hypothetical protein PRIPAC_83745 [Pristionchus pacificus]|uniref:Olfactomedin-like domain-containing protein n=1 Tax=Pristionchus pacificus TaxID=54126 RepID=A0A2A6BKK7_PRIPA|nr:hypothetical protein PRIPAC_83745 [Pristionchus pacificus]|eukprot:PDM66368.1 hypothetical protein PRIPAC_47785 [Pristionchus pacificus]